MAVFTSKSQIYQVQTNQYEQSLRIIDLSLTPWHFAKKLDDLCHVILIFGVAAATFYTWRQ
jgi:hypothetical protein